MHFDNRASKVQDRYWYDTVRKPLVFVVLLIATGFFCEWPDFHPEQFVGSGYHWWLDMIFHGGYYFVITIVLYLVFCKGRKVLLFWVTVLLTSYVFEFIQAFVPGRSLSLLDFTSNLLGILQYAMMGKANWRNLLPGGNKQITSARKK